MIDRLEDGDVLVVTKLDRLGRNAMDVRATVEKLQAEGIRVHCLGLGGVNLASAAGKMTMSVINAVAEFERDLLIERTQAGLRRVKAKGRKLGRRPKLSDEQRRAIRTVERRENRWPCLRGNLVSVALQSSVPKKRCDRHGRSRPARTS